MTDFKYKSEVIGKNGITARVVTKSMSTYSDAIITTWEYDAPKCILAELNTHNILVTNAQSSRAVPVKKVIEQIRNNPVTPVHWGSNQAGMVAGDEINAVPFLCENYSDESCWIPETREEAWEFTVHQVSNLMEAWEDAGYHKQIVNRIGEAFTMVRGVITGTEIDNFFHLRYHKDADPYIQELARCMWEAYELAETEVLYEGEWHLPYIYLDKDKDEPLKYYTQSSRYGERVYHTLEQALKISAAACGQVSYRKLDLSEETVESVWSKLMGGDIIHASVTGHQATPMKEPELISTLQFQDGFGEGVTHIDSNNNFWSAQFKHWVMYRKLIPNESFKGKFVPPI